MDKGPQGGGVGKEVSPQYPIEKKYWFQGDRHFQGTIHAMTVCQYEKYLSHPQPPSPPCGVSYL